MSTNETPAAAVHTLADEIPTTCTVADVCRILNISPATFYLQRSRGTFPIPELLPKLTRGPRFSGEHVKQYLDGRIAPTRKLRRSS